MPHARELGALSNNHNNNNNNTGEINDYASKEWAGLVGTYYRPRWQIFVAYLFDSITKGTVIDPSKYAADLLLWEQRWNNQTNAFPSQVPKLKKNRVLNN
jgi:hypothetical protein